MILEMYLELSYFLSHIYIQPADICVCQICTQRQHTHPLRGMGPFGTYTVAIVIMCCATGTVGIWHTIGWAWYGGGNTKGPESFRKEVASVGGHICRILWPVCNVRLKLVRATQPE